MKKEKDVVYYIDGVCFCNNALRIVRKLTISIWWSLLPLLIMCFLLDLEAIASVEFNYFGGILASIGFLCAWYSVLLYIFKLCVILTRMHCRKKIESFGLKCPRDKR